VSAIRSVYLRVDGFPESRIGEVVGSGYNEVMDNVVALLREAADEMGRLKASEWTPQS
jgi:hypothetical protein